MKKNLLTVILTTMIKFESNKVFEETNNIIEKIPPKYSINCKIFVIN